LDTDVTRANGIADAFYDGGRFPYNDAEFRAVLCNQVLEHVFNPQEFIAEIRRVMVPGGMLLLTVPFVWDEHEQPNDYARYSSFGLKSLLEQQGFQIVRHRKLLADVSVLFQMANAYLYKVTCTRSPYFNLFLTAILFSPVSLIGLVLGICLPKNPDLFLDQLVVAEAQ
jgi:SAM-dependent methyltransferase